MNKLKATATIKQALAGLIKVKVKNDKLTKLAASYVFGVSETTVSNMLYDCEKPSVDTYIQALTNAGFSVDILVK